MCDRFKIKLKTGYLGLADLKMVLKDPGMNGEHKRPGREKMGRERISVMLTGERWGLVGCAALMSSHKVLIGMKSVSYSCSV